MCYNSVKASVIFWREDLHLLTWLDRKYNFLNLSGALTVCAYSSSFLLPASPPLFRVICLCAQFEAVLQHGLRKSRGLALTAAALKQAAGFSSKNEGGTKAALALKYRYMKQM